MNYKKKQLIWEMQLVEITILTFCFIIIKTSLAMHNLGFCYFDKHNPINNITKAPDFFNAARKKEMILQRKN